MIQIKSSFSHFSKTLLLIIFFNTIVSFGLYFLLISNEKEKLYKTNIQFAHSEFHKTKHFMKNKIKHYTNVLDAIEKSDFLDDYLKNNNKKQLVQSMNIIINSNESVFQIRFLDKFGIEKIRIDKTITGETIESINLQNKSNRYYFTKTASLLKDQYYISNLDLNVENSKIEVPYKPTIRVSKPLFKENKFVGMIIINYNVNEIIQSITSSDKFDVYYMDQKGNFLLHPDASKNYSSQLKTNHKVSDEITNIDKIIKTKYDENQKYYLQKIEITDEPFYIIYSIKKDYYESSLQELKTNILYMFFIIILISLPFILIFAYIQSSQARLLEKIIDTIPHPIFFKDQDGKFIMVNESLLKLYQFDTKNAMLGKTAYDILNHKQAEYCTLRDKKAFESGMIVDDEILTLNNKKTYFEIRLATVSFFGIVKKKYLLGVAIDLTEIKLLNMELQDKVTIEVNERLKLEKTMVQQSKLAEMGNMMEAIIHQWKQPLNILSLVSQNLKMKSKKGVLEQEKLITNLDKIVSQVQFMSQTADDFKSFFSVSKSLVHFSVHTSFHKILTILQSRLKTSEISVENNILEDLSIFGYQNEFDQVILNLINNAIDALEDQKTIENKSIFFSSKIVANTIKIYIKDNAGGIPEHLLPDKLFENYTTTKGDNGTGIGLSICKKIIIDNFKGDIKAYNENTQAVFEISFKTD